MGNFIIDYYYNKNENCYKTNFIYVIQLMNSFEISQVLSNAVRATKVAQLCNQ